LNEPPFSSELLTIAPALPFFQKNANVREGDILGHFRSKSDQGKASLSVTELPEKHQFSYQEILQSFTFL